MKIAFYGSSLLSAYWNGAATYYRGLLKALAARGYRITFYEPDVYQRQEHRDIDPPEWCEVVVYDGTIAALRKVAVEAALADVIIKTSGVGFEDDLLLREVMMAARPEALKIFWDVDAPATLAEMRTSAEHPLRQALGGLDLILTYGGGDPVVKQYLLLGAPACIPIYNALDPQTHHPVIADHHFEAALGFLGNRLPDRERRVESFFLEPAAAMPTHRFLLGGAGWDDKPMPGNVRYIGHVPTRDHNAFNVTPRAVLNISRESMADNGFSPATRVFEAAGAGACLITDYWEGIDHFLTPNEEVFVARDGQDVREILSGLTPEHAAAVGRRALAKVLGEHTYRHRAVEVDQLLRSRFASKEAAE
ncbi:glycosyltransferase [Rhizobium sp. CNPSo 3968]|uniref:CgeB family protein n=1 Tax=Rhizobium sp. CNPSo 3968 TaxID=3021408 RepID=UPI00254CD375|nr:glycosyltransferase [Rhizobium sp. CNPSo 3968]MDK4718630.1 glycosyltransferase [Rhizobium sp. CNPSo 3968]